MSLKTTLSEKLSAISSAEFNYIETDDINKISELEANGSGIYMEATVIYFGIKNLSYILKENGRRKTVQTYNMYHEVIEAIAKLDGGYVNSFSPSAFLIIYPGKEDSANKAVRSAWKIAYAISEAFKDQLSHVSGIEFSMGLDHGHIMGVRSEPKMGVSQLTWFGSCVCKAISISRECMRPFYVGISSIIYHNLQEDMLTTYRRILGIKKTVEIWTKVSYEYENAKKHLYQTNYKINFEEQQ